MNVEQKLAQLPANKIYFSMGEVASFCSLEASVIRYWEKEFKQLSPKKINNQRRYKHKDIHLILIIQSLLYDEKLTIQGAIKRLNQQAKQSVTPVKEKNSEALIHTIKTQLQDILTLIKSN